MSAVMPLPTISSDVSFATGALLSDAVCCSVLKCVAVCRSVLQCDAVCCRVLLSESGRILFAMYGGHMCELADVAV